jgi:hypothetical protein
MPEASKDSQDLVNVRWLVGVAGRSTEVPVIAAYVHQHPAVPEDSPVILKDAGHKVVFRGDDVQYVRRDPTAPAGTSAVLPQGDIAYLPARDGLTPAQVRDLQARVNDAVRGELDVARVVVLPCGASVIDLEPSVS